MSRKAVQVMVGAVMLLGWGLWGAHGIPTYRLESLVNYPNPFDSRLSHTTIRYSLEQDAQVTIRLYDVMGNPVREWGFSSGMEGGRQGMNQVAWDGTNGYGEKVSAGGYVCHVMVSEEKGLVQGTRKIGVVH